MEATENKTVWLIGEVCSSLPEGTPLVRDIMRVYFYNRLVLLKQKGASVNSVTQDLIAYWKESGTTIIADTEIVRKISRVIEKHDNYKKSMHRQTHTQECNERKFIDLLNEPFDIFPKQNYHHNKKMKLDTESIKCEIMPVQTSDKNVHTDFDQALCVDDDSSDEENADFTNNNDSDFEMSLSKYQKSKFATESISKPTSVIEKIINSPDVSSVLDRTNISTPKFTLLCAAIAGAVNENLNECTLSTSTIYRRRQIHRDRIVTTIKDDFISSAKSNLVLHWDGKKLLDSTNDDLALRKKRVERLAVVVSGVDCQKIITIAKTKDGSGIVISDTVHEHIVEWNLLDAIIAVCTDTTSSNTGIHHGSVVLFQQLMKRNMLYFACRHHVDEVMIGGVFVKLFGESSGPSPDMFDNFKRDWHAVDQASFKVGSDAEPL